MSFMNHKNEAAPEKETVREEYTGEYVLEVKDLTIRYDTEDAIVHAVSDVSFEVKRQQL